VISSSASDLALKNIIPALGLVNGMDHIGIKYPRLDYTLEAYLKTVKSLEIHSIVE